MPRWLLVQPKASYISHAWPQLLLWSIWLCEPTFVLYLARLCCCVSSQIPWLPLTFPSSPLRTAASRCRWRSRSSSQMRPSTTTPSPHTRINCTSTPCSSNTTTRRPSPRCVRPHEAEGGGAGSEWWECFSRDCLLYYSCLKKMKHIYHWLECVAHSHWLLALPCALIDWGNVFSTSGKKHCRVHAVQRFRWRRCSSSKGELYLLWIYLCLITQITQHNISKLINTSSCDLTWLYWTHPINKSVFLFIMASAGPGSEAAKQLPPLMSWCFHVVICRVLSTQKKQWDLVDSG